MVECRCGTVFSKTGRNQKHCSPTCMRQAFRARHPDRVARWDRDKALRRAGLPGGVDEYDDVLTRQGGRCAICGDPPTPGRHYGVLVADHDHATGLFRGLLCDDCNVVLGRAKDRPDVLRRAAEYLTGDPSVFDKKPAPA